MTRKFYIPLILLAPLFTFGQSGMWTWMKGSSISTSTGTFGTQGVAAASNTPPGLYEAAEWTDAQGNFWLFGGLVSSGMEEYADLWKYDPVSNNWTWVKGPGVINNTGVYGTKGVPALSNNPPALAWGVASWTDLNGDFWLYGGMGNGGIYADLWRYNIASNMWTWMQGPSVTGIASVHGTMGIPAAANTPGSRYETNGTWVDANNNLWLFGGYYNGIWNDLWRYNIATSQWTWMKGSSSVNPVGNYGTKGVAAASNQPGPRDVYSTWTDAIGNFWFFGGNQYPTSSLNDMWRYEPSTNNWTWMSGSNIGDNNGSYGALCTASTSYLPTARVENRAKWKDGCGNFWMYGGARGNSFTYGYNDLWFFNPVTLNWTRVNGSNTTNVVPVYGTQTVAAASNTPGGRAGAIAWRSNAGDLYLFGGTVNGWPVTYNDLWKFKIDSVCPQLLSPAVHLGNDTVYCGSFSRVLSTGISGTVWSTGVTGAQITVTNPGTYWASLNGSCGNARDTISLMQDTIPYLNLGNDTTLCSGTLLLNATGPNVTYHWQDNSTGPTYSVTGAGNYAVTVTTQGGCAATDQITVSTSPVQTINLGSDTVYCSNFNRILSSGIAGTVWSTGVTAAQITVTDPGTYWAVINGVCGNSSDTIALSQDTIPYLNLGSDTNLCNDTLLFNAASPNATYHWQDNSTNATFTVTGAGVYAVTVTAQSGCSASDQITVNASMAIATTVVNTSCGAANGSVSTNVTPGPGPFSYGWSNGDTTAAITHVAAGTYTVTVTGAGGCTATASAVVDSSANAAVVINTDKSIMCSGDSAMICSPAGYASYIWNTGAVSQCIYTKLAGNYYVTVTDALSCTATSNHLAIGVYPLPPVSISVSGDTLIGYNALTYQWYFNGSPITGVTSEMYIANQMGYYSLAVTDSNGCGALSNPVFVTAVDEINAGRVPGVKIFPNPNRTGNWQLEVENTWLNSKLEVVDATGRLILRSEIRKQKSEISFEAANGVYILRIFNPERNTSIRLVKR